MIEIAPQRPIPAELCGRASTCLHTRKTARVDGFCVDASTHLLKPQENCACGRVDRVDSLKGVAAASTRRPAALPWEVRP